MRPMTYFMCSILPITIIILNNIFYVEEPEFISNRPTLTATSTSCVNLSWTEPEHLGGTITQYQYRCDGSSWNNSTTSRSVSLCGYQPFTFASCQLRARNPAGWGGSENLTAITKCAAPRFTKAPLVEESYDSIRKRRKVEVTVEGVVSHCASLKPLEYQTADRMFSTSSTLRDLNALTLYSVTIRATNNDGLSNEECFDVTTRELEPWSEPIIENTYHRNKSCVVAEWEEPNQPNGVITKYEYQCAMEEEPYQNWVVETGKAFDQCGYSPGNLVKCRVRAFTAIGPGPSEEFFINITCENPSPPSFTLSSKKISSDQTEILIDLEESMHNCRSMKSYVIAITGPNGQLFDLSSDTVASNVTVEGASPFTNYTVTIEAINDACLKSRQSRYLITAETRLPEEPRVVIESNTRCITVHLMPPEVPNGVILSYMVSCGYGLFSESTIKVEAEEDESATTNFCSLPSATLITCRIAARNSFGLGKEALIQEYTRLQWINTNWEALEETTERRSTGVVVKIRNIQIEKGYVRSYLVALSKKPVGDDKNDTVERGCTKEPVTQRYIESKECYCYTTAELTAAEVGEELIFTIGDGETYGGYLNGELEAEAEYKVYIAVKVDTEKGFEPLIELYPNFITVTAPQAAAAAIWRAMWRDRWTVALLIVFVIAFVIVCAIVLVIVNRECQQKDTNQTGAQKKTATRKCFQRMFTESTPPFAKYEEGPGCSKGHEKKTLFQMVNDDDDIETVGKAFPSAFDLDMMSPLPTTVPHVSATRGCRPPTAQHVPYGSWEFQNLYDCTNS